MTFGPRSIIRWFSRPWRGTSEARRHLEATSAEGPAVRALAEEVRVLHRENHITARIHEAFRGGHP